MKAPWAPVRRNRRPEAHFGSQGANFSENRCNRQSARRGVRIRHPWRREAAGRSGRPEKRDGQRCQLGPQHKMFLVGPGPDNSVEPTQLSDVSNRAPLPAQGVDHVGRCPLRHNASHTPAGSTAAGAPTAEMVRVLKKCEVARSPEDRSCRHVVEHVCLLGPTLAELIRTFGWPPSRTQQIPPGLGFGRKMVAPTWCDESQIAVTHGPLRLGNVVALKIQEFLRKVSLWSTTWKGRGCSKPPNFGATLPHRSACPSGRSLKKLTPPPTRRLGPDGVN